MKKLLTGSLVLSIPGYLDIVYTPIVTSDNKIQSAKGAECLCMVCHVFIDNGASEWPCGLRFDIIWLRGNTFIGSARFIKL